MAPRQTARSSGFLCLGTENSAQGRRSSDRDFLGFAHGQHRAEYGKGCLDLRFVDAQGRAEAYRTLAAAQEQQAAVKRVLNDFFANFRCELLRIGRIDDVKSDHETETP